MTVSVIICTRNREKELLACLKCLEEQLILPEECILIENVSEKKNFSQKRLKDFFTGKKIETRYLPVVKKFLSTSRNMGIRACKSDIGIFIDDDVLFDRDLVQNFKLLHQKYSKAFGFVGKVFPLLQDEYSRFGSWYFSRDLLWESRMKRIRAAAGSTFSFKKSVILQNQVWNNEAWETGEDIDFFLRLYKLKQKLYFHPSIVTYHKFANTLSSFIRKHIKYAQNFANLAKEYPEYISIEEFLPYRKLDWLFLPFFVLRISLSTAKINKFESRLVDISLKPFFLANLGCFLGIYTSKEGLKTLMQRFFKMWLNKQR